MLKNLFTVLIAASFVTLAKLAAPVDAGAQVEPALIAGRLPWTAVRGTEPPPSIQVALLRP